MKEGSLAFPELNEKFTSRVENIVGEQYEKRDKAYRIFNKMPISKELKAGLKRANFFNTTPIQREAIPVILSGRDTMIMSRTGSGKTAAFVVPMIEKLKQHSKTVGVRGIIIAPSRELAMQIFDFTTKVAKNTTLKIAAIVGGDSLEKQFSRLALNPDILIATPGRLNHIIDETHLMLSRVEYLAFDEADRLFEMGFQYQINRILGAVTSSTRQVVMVSATLPSVLLEFTRAGLKDPAFVKLTDENKLPKDLKTQFMAIRTSERIPAVLHILRNHCHNQATILFVATKHHAELMHKICEKALIRAAICYGAMDQEARNLNVDRFRNGKVNLLIVTDVAARGIDIPLINNVVNMHFPDTTKLFIHRVGRAARAGRTGTAYSIFSPSEAPYVYQLYKFLRRDLQKLDNAQASLEIIEKIEEYKNIGKIPLETILGEVDEVINYLKYDVDIASQNKSAERGYKLYKRSRANAMSWAIRTAKHAKVPTHPLFVSANASIENKQEVDDNDGYKITLDNLASFKPKLTVFEMKGMEHTDAYAMMQKRRVEKANIDRYRSSDDVNLSSAHKEQAEQEKDLVTQGKLAKSEPTTLREKLLAKAAARLSEDESSNVKYEKDQSQEFVSYQPDAYQSMKEDESAYKISEDDVFNVNGEENSTFDKNRSLLKWDAKKKKYVIQHLISGQRMNMKTDKIRNESGVKILAQGKSNKKSLYLKWREKTQQRIQRAGEEEDLRGLSYSHEKALRTAKISRADAMKRAEEKQELRKLKQTNPKAFYERTKEIAESKMYNDELKTSNEIRKSRSIKRKRKYTDFIRSEVKHRGKLAVSDALSRRGMAKKMKKIQETQKHYNEIRAKKKGRR
mmetsp:Transcript_10560/g.15448  ORF Transcript_10560/g.15448 Transcript_10560/m.15448 type:complete len:854 (+) Transcript_10560:36-2597(+)